MKNNLKPIRSKKDHEAALKEVERLWGAKLGTEEGDRLDVLATLIDVYEAAHYPVDPPDPIEAIKFRMEQSGLAIKDLEPMIGRLNRVYEVLAGAGVVVHLAEPASGYPVVRGDWLGAPVGRWNCERPRLIHMLSSPTMRYGSRVKPSAVT